MPVTLGTLIVMTFQANDMAADRSPVESTAIAETS
jgi:hypothetical protein